MGQLSLIDGRFKFIQYTGQYKVAISFMGFETWESDLIIISDEVNKDLGTILLKIKSIESQKLSITEQRDARISSR